MKFLLFFFKYYLHKTNYIYILSMRPFPQNQTLPLPPGGKGGEWWGMLNFNALHIFTHSNENKNNFHF